MWGTHNPIENDDDRDAVFFESVEYICDEFAGTIQLVIRRRGHANRRSTVDWETQNRNLDAGSYKYQSGTVTFESGKKKVSIVVNIFQNAEWSTEGLMHVCLKNPSKYLLLGELRVTTIVVLNDDKFPSGIDPNETKTIAAEEGSSQESSENGPIEVDVHSEMEIVQAFFKHNVTLMKKDTKSAIIFKMVPALCWLFRTFLIYYAILSGESELSSGPIYVQHLGNNDDINTPIVSLQARAVLIIMGILFIINHIVECYFHEKYMQLRLVGKASMKLRTAVMDTSIQLNNMALEEFTTGRVTKIMEESVKEAISKGWDSIFELWENLFMMFINGAWVIYLAMPNKLYILSFPFSIALVNYIIFETQRSKLTNMVKTSLIAGEKWCEFFTEAADLRRLINDYRMGLDQANVFSSHHAAHNKAAFAASSYKRRAMYMATCMPVILIGFIFGFSWTDDFAAGNNDAPIALFVTLVSVVTEFGNRLTMIFNIIFSFSDAAASIKSVSALLNSDTRRADLHHSAKHRGKLMIEAIADGVLEEDDERVVAHNLCYTYVDMTTLLKLPIIPNISFSFESGQILALDATRAGTGNRTLLKLLARQLEPQKGFVSYPPYWRVRLLAMPPLLANGTLRENLLFGVRARIVDAEVIALCERLKMSAYLVHDLRTTGGSVQLGGMGEKLCLTDRVMITIARAILSNVDLLLIHGLMDIIGTTFMQNTMAVLREMVLHRGLPLLRTEMMKTPEHLKKIKTIIISTKLDTVMAQSDNVHTMKEMQDYQLFFCSDELNDDESRLVIDTIEAPEDISVRFSDDGSNDNT